MLTALKIRIPLSYANIEYLRPNFLEVESEMESFTHKIVEESFTMPFFFFNPFDVFSPTFNHISNANHHVIFQKHSCPFVDLFC